MSSLSGRRANRYGWSSCDPPRRPVLFVNPRSGDGAAGRAGLAARARDRGITVVVLDPGHSLTTHVDEAIGAGADALGMAGGDGSLAVVAAAAAAHHLPLICVPAGTRNHFALELGVGRHDPVGALDAFTDGVERRIDLAEVNGRAFLNNVSRGIYGEAVRQSAYRDAKVRTLVQTAEQVLGPSGKTPALCLVDDAGREHACLAVVLVSRAHLVPTPWRLAVSAPPTSSSHSRASCRSLRLEQSDYPTGCDDPSSGGRDIRSNAPATMAAVPAPMLEPSTTSPG
jgi:diacylglycerol kinase family enzyme